MSILRRVTNLFSRSRVDREIDAELQSHIDLRVEDNFHAAGTSLLSGRAFTWADDKKSTLVAVVNREFARKIFGTVAIAMGGHYKMPDGSRIQVVGVVEDGKYGSLTEEPVPAMFLPILQSPSSSIWLVVHSSRDQKQLAPAIRATLRILHAGLPVCWV